MFRAGFLYSTQDGNATTTRLSSWGFPDQASFSLTPQIRLRAGISPTHYALTDGVDPNKSWGTEYTAGGTVKYWDRLTLDGDAAITHFSQSGANSMTFRGQAEYAFTDSIRAKVGMSRLPETNSLLALTGFAPDLGAYKGQVLGMVRENSLFGELDTNPFNHNWDWNLAYTWSYITGNQVPRNTKNQVFSSFGHTWHYGAKQQVRLAYEFLLFRVCQKRDQWLF